MHTKSLSEYLKGRDHSEDLGVDGRILWECVFREIGWEVDWIHLAQDRNWWRAVMNTVMKIWVT
jgi:hypothetical protein